MAFHELVAASGSVLLAELYEGIVEARRRGPQFDDAELAREPGGAEIDDLVRAIEQRDPEAAEPPPPVRMGWS